jgi:serine/threonine-protein kinase
MPTPPSQLDDAVNAEEDAVVLRALAKHVEDRYQTAAEFRDDVERAMHGAPVTAAVPAVIADPTTQMAPVTAAMPRYEESYERPARRGRSAGFWIVSLLAIIGAIAGAWFIGQFLLGSGGSRVQVPNLDGLTIEQATGALNDVDLRLGAQTPELSDRPDGTIIAQQPAAGEQLETGQAVNVTVSSGVEQVVVPPLVGLTSTDAARTALEDANLTLGEVVPVDSDQPAGYVLSSDPVEGSSVDTGSPVGITVSSGLVAVPKVKGSYEAQARADLTAAGFEIAVTYQSDNVSPAGIVLAQSPKAGTSLERGAVVTITVAVRTGPEPEPSPTVVPSGDPTDLPTAPASDGPPQFAGSLAPAPQGAAASPVASAVAGPTP